MNKSKVEQTLELQQMYGEISRMPSGLAERPVFFQGEIKNLLDGAKDWSRCSTPLGNQLLNLVKLLLLCADDIDDFARDGVCEELCLTGSTPLLRRVFLVRQICDLTMVLATEQKVSTRQSASDVFGKTYQVLFETLAQAWAAGMTSDEDCSEIFKCLIMCAEMTSSCEGDNIAANAIRKYDSHVPSKRLNSALLRLGTEEEKALRSVRGTLMVRWVRDLKVSIGHMHVLIDQSTHGADISEIGRQKLLETAQNIGNLERVAQNLISAYRRGSISNLSLEEKSVVVSVPITIHTEGEQINEYRNHLRHRPKFPSQTVYFSPPETKTRAEQIECELRLIKQCYAKWKSPDPTVTLIVHLVESVDGNDKLVSSVNLTSK